MITPSPSLPTRLLNSLHSLLRDTLRVFWSLARIMVPALIVVKAIDMAGGSQWLAWALAPAMQLAGLPQDIGIVWATTMLTNLYTGIAVFFGTGLHDSLSVAQVTVLACMMLVAHGLPVEGAIARAAGMPWAATLALRIGGGLALGALLNLLYGATGTLQSINATQWRPAPPASSGLADWALEQLIMMAWILPVILVLLLVLRLLRLLGIERLIHAVLAPVLRLAGIGDKAVSTIVVGITLGLSYGGGLLIQDARSGAIGKRDILLAVAFISLCHSLIEDTLLVMLIGADLSGILWARLLFSLVVVGVLARLLPTSTQTPARAGS